MRFLSIFTATLGAGGVFSLSLAGQWEISPSAVKSFGSTLYRLEAPAGSESDYFGNPINYFVKSELRFPLDYYGAGVVAAYSDSARWHGKIRRWRINGAYTRSVTDPFEKMQDDDWVGAREGSGSGFSTTHTEVLQKFSHTFSEARGEGQSARLFAEVEWGRLFGRPMMMGLGYALDAMEFDLGGVEGWQLGLSNDSLSNQRYYFKEFQDTSVLEYRVHYQRLDFTAQASPWQSRGFFLHSTLALSPLVWAGDLDRHLLRNKKSEASTLGYGLGLEMEAGSRIFGGGDFLLSAGFRYLRTWGKMDQQFYGDDPGTVGVDETGLEFNDVNTWIISLTGHLSMAFRCRF